MNQPAAHIGADIDVILSLMTEGRLELPEIEEALIRAFQSTACE
jgi:hypothetical protein